MMSLSRRIHYQRFYRYYCIRGGVECPYSHPVQIHDSNHTLRHSSWPMTACTDQKESFSARNGGPTYLKYCFLSPFIHRRERSFPSSTSPEAATLSQPSTEACSPPIAPPFLLAHNLSTNDIAQSDHWLKVTWCQLASKGLSSHFASHINRKVCFVGM